MTDPFPASDFDAWAADYDTSLHEDAFPFWGYGVLLQRIASLGLAEPGQRVLDLGTGTGNLALPFARRGCELWCTDFSPAMLEQARRKLPGARFLLHDLRQPFPTDWSGPFDSIVSAYVFHHFQLEEKVRILRELAGRLAPGGSIRIGDIAFPDAAAMDAVRQRVGADWEQEYYWLADESVAALERAGLRAEFTQVSACAGIFHLSG